MFISVPVDGWRSAEGGGLWSLLIQGWFCFGRHRYGIDTFSGSFLSFLKNFTQACRRFTANVSYHGIFCICLRLTGSRHVILCLVSCSIILVTLGP